MNESGMITGEMYYPNGKVRFIWSNGSITQLDSSIVKVCGINHKGQIAVETKTGAGRWEHGKLTVVPPPSKTQSPLGKVAGIDDSGTLYGELMIGSEGMYTVVTWPGTRLGMAVPRPTAIAANGSIVGTLGIGQQFPNFHRPTAWLWQRNMPQQPIGDGDHRSIPTCVSPNLHVGGFYTSSKSLVHLPFMWYEGKYLELPVPHQSRNTGQIHAIDDEGNAVGQCGWQEKLADGNALVLHGVIWRNGEVQDLNDLIPSDSSITIVDALAMNSSGKILAVTQPKGQNEYPNLVILRPNR